MKPSIGYVNDVHGYVEPHNELFYEGAKANSNFDSGN